MYRNSNTQMNDVFNNYKNLTITSIKISRDIIQATMGLLTTTIFSNFHCRNLWYLGGKCYDTPTLNFTN